MAGPLEKSLVYRAEPRGGIEFGGPAGDRHEDERRLRRSVLEVIGPLLAKPSRLGQWRRRSTAVDRAAPPLGGEADQVRRDGQGFAGDRQRDRRRLSVEPLQGNLVVIALDRVVHRPGDAREAKNHVTTSA